jgi:uncharacterized membrane protein
VSGQTQNHRGPPGFWRRLQGRFLRYSLTRPLAARPRLLGSILVGLAAAILLRGDWRAATRVLVAWNCGALLYLALSGAIMFIEDHEALTRRASTQDEGRFVILGVAVLATMASIGAIVVELASVKTMEGFDKGMHVGLAALTILTAWTFIHLMFALHYAHEFANERGRRGADAEKSGGLQFPGTTTPDYADFVYFSFVIGVACQTADVSISSQMMRRIALVHGVAAFFFNTTILALTINIAAGLI